MRISERGQITIPKPLRERYGLDHNVEVEVTPTDDGLLIRKQAAGGRPVDRVYGILRDSGQAAGGHPVDKIAGILDEVERPGIPTNVDEYIEEIRGR